MANWRAGILINEKVVDASIAAKTADLGFQDNELSNRTIIQLSRDEQSQLENSAQELAKSSGMEDVLLGPPIPDPDKIICLGLNYKSHAEEAGFKPPEVPILFAKYRNALIGPTSPIVLPKVSQEIDYEGELAVVIGKRGKNIPVEKCTGVCCWLYGFARCQRTRFAVSFRTVAVGKIAGYVRPMWAGIGLE